MMKNKILLFAIFGISLLVLISLSLAQEKYAYIGATLMNQDPYPAEPNTYLDLLFKLENNGGLTIKDFMIEIIPEYPFSLDPNSTGLISIGNIDGLQKDGEAIFAKFRVRVDKDVFDGYSKIKIRYVYNSDGKWIDYFEEKFDVNVENPQTDFDVAVQDFSPTTKALTLAISNIGEEDANSVTVSIPDQTSYEFLGTDKNIIGNIAKNDYTIASFKINPKQDGPLIVKIAYTDSIGIRRELEKTVMFKASAFSAKTNGTEQTGLSKPLIYVIVGILGLIIIFVLFRILRKKKK